MGCHETLMARRRKKSKAAQAAKSREKDHSPMITDKSLPALPPNVIPNNAFSNDRVDPESDTPTELSPRPRQGHRHTESSSRSSSRPAARSPERQSKPEGLGLSYRANRSSTMMSNESSTNDDGFFIPVALDPSPGPSSNSRSGSGNVGDASKRKDYFSIPKSSFSDKRAESQSSTPHIAFQEKNRQQSSDYGGSQSGSLSRNLSKQSKHDESSNSAEDKPPKMPPRPKQGTEDTKSQDAARKRQSLASPSGTSPAESTAGTPGLTAGSKDSAPLSESRKTNENILPRRSHDSRRPEQEEGRQSGDSGTAPPRAGDQKAIPRKEVGSNAAKNGMPKPAPILKPIITDPIYTAAVKTPDETSRQARPTLADNKNPGGSYMHPRSAPAPPPAGGKEGPDGEKTSPKLPRWSSGGDFSMDEDMARILGTDEDITKMLRRTSHIARHGRTSSVESAAQTPSRTSHGRSVSETTRATGSPTWQRHVFPEDRNGKSPDTTSPASLPPNDDPVQLKRQLTRSEQRVAELERQFNTEKDLKNLNKKLIEKRKTVSVLDTQTEIMIRQLEVLAGYVEKAKETKTPLDPRELEDSALKDFVQKLESVKIAMSETIEQLHEERDKLLEEKSQAAADRDRALMEFEQLSSKNAQLADMNNDLTHQLQERMKNSSIDPKSLNGLGIYSDGKGTGASSVNLDGSSTMTGPTLIAADDDHIVEGPTVVQVRKGQVRKFNWKKGSKGLAQNVAKGVNRAVVAFQQNDRGERVPTQVMAGDSIGMPYNATVTAVESPALPGGAQTNNQIRQVDHTRQGFGFFSKKHNMPKSQSTSAVSTPAAVADASTTLFGSDLCERADFERRQIPSVVTRCIEEVELRGMDQEGIYRKTGGNSQVNMIKEGFDKCENFDISDPDLDITAVTSVLKQYFRKLPIPLLTYDVYDRVLESASMFHTIIWKFEY